MSKENKIKNWSVVNDDLGIVVTNEEGNIVCEVREYLGRETDAILKVGHLAAAAPDLLEAAELQESAETHYHNCVECGGEGIPEACGACFPHFDKARVARRAAIAKARGGSDVD